MKSSLNSSNSIVLTFYSNDSFVQQSGMRVCWSFSHPYLLSEFSYISVFGVILGFGHLIEPDIKI